MRLTSEPVRPGVWHTKAVVSGVWLSLAVIGCSGPATKDRVTPGWFTDVTAEAGLSSFLHVTGAAGNKWMPETMGGGAGFFDFDGDGATDILLVRGGGWEEPVQALALYRNNGDGTFSDRTAEAGLDRVHSYAFGVTAADYDNDGDDDFYLTALHRNMLFRNDDARFVEVAVEAGVAGPEEWSTAAVFFDADRNGWLDLYVGNYVEWRPEIDTPCSIADGVRSYCTPDLYEGLPGRFYLSNGDGTFTEATAESGLGPPVPGKTLGAAILDHNGDGWIDLVVVNDTERNLLYENDGDGTFTERGILSGIAFDNNGRARAGMGVDVAMVDSTNLPTVFIGNFPREMVAAYRYSPSGMFVDRAIAYGIAPMSANSLTFGLFTFDADLDGFVDLFTANGHITPDIERIDGVVEYRQPAKLFRNLGTGAFESINPSAEGDVWEMKLVGRGAAYADYDADGDLDIAIVENGGPVHLWRNEVNGRSLRIRLEGSRSNRSAIGARVRTFVRGRESIRLVRTGSSYLSHSETVLTFGLGTAEKADSVIVHWPSGRVETIRDVSGGEQIHVVEAEEVAVNTLR